MFKRFKRFKKFKKFKRFKKFKFTVLLSLILLRLSARDLSDPFSKWGRQINVQAAALVPLTEVGLTSFYSESELSR